MQQMQNSLSFVFDLIQYTTEGQGGELIKISLKLVTNRTNVIYVGTLLIDNNLIQKLSTTLRYVSRLYVIPFMLLC